jgi:hypothetical protein
MQQDKRWLGVAYWPLSAFNVYLNEVVLDDTWHLRTIEAANDEELYKFFGDNVFGDIILYWKHFLLLDDSDDPSPWEWSTPPKVSMLGYKDMRLRDAYESIKDPICRKLPTNQPIAGIPEWRTCLGVLPQHEDTPDLSLGRLSKHNIVSNKFLSSRDLRWEATENLTNPLPQFYALTEWLCSDHFITGDSKLSELLEFSKTEFVHRHLPRTSTKIGKIKSIAIRSSFFADRVCDIVFFLPLMLHLSEDGDCDNNPKLMQLAAGLQGAAYSIRNRRLHWLNDWIQRLKQRIVSKMILIDKRHKDSAKQALSFATDAIVDVTQVLMGCKNQHRLLRSRMRPWTLSALSKDSEWEAPRLETVRNILLEFHPRYTMRKTAMCRPRAEYVARMFTIPACEAAVHTVLGLSHGNLKGTLALDTKLALRDRAQYSPQAARMLLQGPPGGGKGAASKDYHTYWMERLTKLIQYERYLDINQDKEQRHSLVKKAIRNSGDSAWQESGELLRYIKSIAQTLESLLTLPPFRRLSSGDDTDPETVIKVCKEQLEGTRWWTWHDNNDHSLGCPYQRWYDDGDDEYLDHNHPNIEFMRFLASTVGLDNEQEPIHRNYESCVKFAIAGYLSHFIQHLFYVKSFPEEERDWSFNFVQITCGTLGGEGEELRVALRQLFGQADGDGGTVPGLFQICSYMGGTLFLDEIADAPIKIQDNLLMPLEEKKVFRSGWETLKEDVGNVRIVAATYKDLRTAVALYKETLTAGSPQGFRPDLLTRLAGTPPVDVAPIYEYFLYEQEGHSRSRERFRFDFVSIMVTLCGKDLGCATSDIKAFWNHVYNDVDRKIGVAAATHHKFTTSMSPLEKRKVVASKLSMRFFIFMSDTLKETLKKYSGKDIEDQSTQGQGAKPAKSSESKNGEHPNGDTLAYEHPKPRRSSDDKILDLKERMAYLRNDYLPQMLTYLLNS